MSVQNIGARLGMSNQRAGDSHARALCWEPTRGERLSAQASIETLRIDRRAIAALQRAGIDTVGAVGTLDDTALRTISEIGSLIRTQIRADLLARYDDSRR